MSQQCPYRNPELPVDVRVNDLIGRMTLEEKVGQMCQLDGRQDPERQLEERKVGSFLHVLGEDTLRLQRLAAQTRLGIPLIFGLDCIHGHAFWPGATVFPTQLAMSCSWNPDMAELAGRITAVEASATGIHWTFSPVLCMARDLRWGRVGETFGEDGRLIAAMARAMVRGYQGGDLGGPGTILACAKHYAGYSETQGGRDSSEADHSRRKLLSVFLPPFEAVARGGCATFMTAYEAIDGEPCTSNRWLLTELLKDAWGLDGFVVTDWNNVGNLHTLQKTCETQQEAAARAVEAGNDMMMSTPWFAEAAVRAVRSGRLDEKLIDGACRRILRVKFRLGLFDDRRLPDLAAARGTIGCAAHREAALECALQSIVLLENRGEILPLDERFRRIAVIGPNADDVLSQLGDWSLGSGQAGGDAKHPRDRIVTVLDGVRARAGNGATVTFARGCDTVGADTSGIEEAVAAARAADVAVVVVGDSLPLIGEGRDRASLDLTGAQLDLLKAVKAAGTPMVVILIASKPLSIPWLAINADALLAAFNPGMCGGTAVAALLFGDRTPSGKLSVSFPYHVGQQPVYYNQVPGWHGGRYVDMPAAPLYAFGYGLSYTSFAYSALRVSPGSIRAGDSFSVEVDVENTGTREGVEVVQVYSRDEFASVTVPVKELVAFDRVSLRPGQKRTVRFELPATVLSLVNRELRRVVEPGGFVIMAGGSSRDCDLLCAPLTVTG